MAEPSFVDDLSVENHACLWRRICPQWIVLDGNSGTRRVSSAAFDDSPDGSPMSVLLADVVRESGRDGLVVLEVYSGYSLASITAGTARLNQQGIARTPEPDEPAHASVFGQKTRSVKRSLARAAEWVIGPL